MLWLRVLLEIWRYWGPHHEINPWQLMSWCQNTCMRFLSDCCLQGGLFACGKHKNKSCSLTLWIYLMGLWNNLFWSLFQVSEVLFLLETDSRSKVNPTINRYMKLNWVLLVFSISVRWEVLEVMTKILIREYSFQALEFFASILQICLLKFKLKCCIRVVTNESLVAQTIYMTD